MNASLTQLVAPVTKHLAVADANGALTVTLFPRRIVPPAIVAAVVLPTLLAMVLALFSFGRENPIFFSVSCVWLTTIPMAFVPYRLVFRLDARGLEYVGAPKAKAHRLSLSLDQIEAIRAVRKGDQAHVGVFEVGGRVHLVACFRMRREDADAIAFALGRRLEELRVSRETFRA